MYKQAKLEKQIKNDGFVTIPMPTDVIADGTWLQFFMELMAKLRHHLRAPCQNNLEYLTYILYLVSLK